MEGYHCEEREKRVFSVLRRDMVGWVVGLLGWCRGDESWTHSMVPVAFFVSFLVFFPSSFRFPGAAAQCLPARLGRCFFSRLLDQARVSCKCEKDIVC